MKRNINVLFTLIFASCFALSACASSAITPSDVTSEPSEVFAVLTPAPSEPGDTMISLTAVPEPTLPPATEKPTETPEPTPKATPKATSDPKNSSGSHGGKSNSGNSGNSGGGHNSSRPDRPVYISFPQYGEGCPVEPVGINSSGEMGTLRTSAKAGWLKTSGTPVKGGNIIIAAHNRYSHKNGAFYVMKGSLKAGDTVTLKLANGTTVNYRVERIEEWEFTNVPAYVMQLGGEARLTLITCKGDFDHSVGTSRHRIIAICKPIS